MKLFKRLSILLFTLVFACAEMLSLSMNAFAAEPTTVVNLSKGKPYTNIGDLSSETPDTNGTELTDGIFGNGSNKNAAWNGTWHRSPASGMVYDEWPLYSTIIDLQGIKSITQVKANFLRFYAAYAHMPKTIKVFASVDGENWMKLSYLNDIPWDISDGIYSFGWHVADHSGNKTTDLTGNANSSVKARYVRFDYESRSGYTLCDEVTVMGYNGEKSSAITPYNTRKLENGNIMLADEQTGNIQDMVLIYQNREWTKEGFKPYLTYVDTEGKSVDTLYDSVLFLQLSSPDGKSYDREDENLAAKDWTDYLNTTFVGNNSTINALNEAAKQASVDLNKPDYKVNLVVMVPYPAAKATNFGTVDGRNLNLSVESDWKYLIDWYLNKVISYVNDGNYDYIDFKGFYWVNEAPNYKERIIYTNDRIDALGYKSYWIPFFHSEGYFWNEDLGFSALTLQPNHFFAESTGNTLGNGGTKIIETVAKLGAYADFGVEMEFDGRLTYEVDAYNRFLDYLNASVKMGFDGPGYFRNWYEAGGAILQIYNSRVPALRMLYDNIYQMIKGTYVQREYIDDYNDNLLLGKSYTHNGTDWYADRSNDAGSVFLTDGKTGGTYYSSEYFGVKDQDVTIEMDLSDASLTFKELHIEALTDSKSAVYAPKTVKIYAKSPLTSEWNVIYDGAYPQNSRAVFRSNTDIEATGLKFEFTVNGSYIFLKEILAYDEATCVKGDATLIGNGNLLAGKTYTHNVTNWYKGESRDSGTALTDGVKGGSFYGTDYFNVQQNSVWVEFDLGTKTKIKEIHLNSLVDSSAAVYPPKAAKIYLKANEEDDWMLVYNGPVGEKDFVFANSKGFDASKIKIEFFGVNVYIFLKEIEAYSNITTLTPNAEMATAKNYIQGLIPTSESTVIKTFAYQGTQNVAILTDGIVKTDAVSYKNNITFSDSPVSFVYDKTGMKFKEINVSLNNPSDLTVRSISGLKIERYTNGKWETIADRQDIPDSTVGKTYAFVSDTPITAHKLRITLTKSSTTPCDWNGLSLSEIQVLEEAVTEEPIGTFKFPEAPVIETDLPASVTITEGDDLTLSVSAKGNGTLSYQWYKDGKAVANATASSYKVTQSGTYYVVVTNTLYGNALSVNSFECDVTVQAKPLVPAQDAFQFSKTEVSEGEEFVMTFTMPETRLASSLGLTVLFDNKVFEITNIAEAKYADMQPYLPGCNTAGNVTISWCDPTFNANTIIEAGETLLEVTFKVKEGVSLGNNDFVIADWNVLGDYNEETYEMELITPDAGAMSKTVEIIEKEGFNVSGSVKAFGSSSDAVTVELVSGGNVIKTATVKGNSGTYAFEDVAAGSYTIKVSKTKHASREYEIKVSDTDVSQDVQIWLYGDVTGDGIVNNNDAIQINRKNANLTSVFDKTTDVAYRFIIANVTAITGTDTIVNNTDVMHINRRNANQASVFDRLL